MNDLNHTRESLEADLDAVQVLREPPPTPCARLIGCAGTGKSYTLMSRRREDPSYGILTATTGISAINIGGVTINSTLKYFDTRSLRDALLQGRLTRSLHSLALVYRWLIIEEYSMLDADQLDILHRALTQANAYADITRPMGILLVGDLAQLPPVKAQWCFRAGCWPEFASHTEKLTHVYRQSNGPFLDALNAVREGNGTAGADYLTAAGVQWHSQVDTEFEGTTILPKNRAVDNYNWDVLRRVPGSPFTLKTRRWGQQYSEWGLNPRTHEWGIPPIVDLRVGAYVMILANQTDLGMVNGDCGHVIAHVRPEPPYADSWETEHVIVKLVRTGEEVNVYPVVRGYEVEHKPDDWTGREPHISVGNDCNEYIPKRHYRAKVRRYVLGQVAQWPIRLAYASTVHKSQSLTLDRVQVDFRDQFFSSPAMLYVALSRCRTLDGLRLVGDRDRFIKHCNVDKAVIQWL